MKTIRIALPDPLADLWDRKQNELGDLLAEDMKRTFVLRLVQQEEITTREAADLLGMPWPEFLKIANRAGLPYLHLEPTDRANEWSTARRVAQQAFSS